MDRLINFPDGARVDAQYGQFTIKTDQSIYGGGNGEAPTPFSLFLASMGTCAGIYVLNFCKKRGLATDNIQILQRIHNSPSTHMIEKIELIIQVPKNFPEKYRPSLIRSAELCAVKKHLENPPEFEIITEAYQTVS
jgi:ribosomal protein S12 methylthiotransferase accessory factor